MKVPDLCFGGKPAIRKLPPKTNLTAAVLDSATALKFYIEKKKENNTMHSAIDLLNRAIATNMRALDADQYELNRLEEKVEDLFEEMNRRTAEILSMKAALKLLEEQANEE